MQNTLSTHTTVKKTIVLLMATAIAFTFSVAKMPLANAEVTPESFLEGLSISEDGNSATTEDGFWAMNGENLTLTADDGTVLIDSPLRGANIDGTVDGMNAVISPDSKTVILNNTGPDPTYVPKDQNEMRGRVIWVDELIRRYQQYIITSFRYDKERFFIGGIAGVLAANVIVWLIFASLEAPIFMFAMPLWLPVFALWILTEFIAGFLGFYAGSTLIGLTSDNPEVRRDAELTLEEYNRVQDEYVNALIEVFA